MKRRRVSLLGGALLACLFVCPARAAVTGDLILSLQYRNLEYANSALQGGVRLVGDADLSQTVRAHLDYNHRGSVDQELDEAYVEWGAAKRRLRVGRFLLPFGIYNYSELYYVGLVYAPILKYYQGEGYLLGRSEHGLFYLQGAGVWQVEAALFADHGGVRALIPSGGQGSIRVQRYAGPVIIGLSLLRQQGEEPETRDQGTARFIGLDARFSRPSVIVRGEAVTGRVPGGSPWGFYVDILYRPLLLRHGTIVGRVEAASGRDAPDPTYRRQTIGLKWELGHATSIAVNQVFESPRSRFSREGTVVYLWYTHRL
jgi:hypothetical protein